MSRIASAIALTLLAAPLAAQGIALAGADDLPGYASGTTKYRTTSTYVTTGPYPMNINDDGQITVAIAPVRQDVLAATFSIISKTAEVNGLQVLVKINANGKAISADVLNPKSDDSQMYGKMYMSFLPPLPPSYVVGTKWNVPVVMDTTMSDAFSSTRSRSQMTTNYVVAADTVVGGVKAVKVGFTMTGTTTSTSRSMLEPKADPPMTSTMKGEGFHVFSKAGVYLGSRSSSESTIGEGKDQTRVTTSGAVDVIQ